MQVLIIEDEYRAANQLQKLLNDCGFKYSLLDTLDSVEESIKWLEKHPSPDLIFMDIQLADGLCFEIFQKTNVVSPIIFTTAFDQYAIQAFKVNSIDYLLKPIQKEDLEYALNKFQQSKSKQSLNPTILENLMKQLQVQSKRTGILVKDGNGLIQLKIEELQYCYSENSITFGVTPSKRYIIEETMDQLMESLDIDQFYKINRGQIISKSAVQKIEPYFNHRVKIAIANPRDQEFIVSRQKTSEFKEWMNR